MDIMSRFASGTSGLTIKYVIRIIEYSKKKFGISRAVFVVLEIETSDRIDVRTTYML